MPIEASALAPARERAVGQRCCVGLLAVAGLLLGCGDDHGGAAGAAGAGGAGGTGRQRDGSSGAAALAGAGGSTASGGATSEAVPSSAAETRERSGCPDTRPEHGSACDAPDLRCTYGEHPRLSCRGSAVCIANPNDPVHWESVPGTCAALADSCPASPSEPCSPDGFEGCFYPDGTDCSICQPCCDAPACAHGCDGGPGDSHWLMCTAPPSTEPGCPERIPNIGTDCSVEGQVCYRELCLHDIVCLAGSWQWDASAYAVPACDTRGG